MKWILSLALCLVSFAALANLESVPVEGPGGFDCDQVKKICEHAVATCMSLKTKVENQEAVAYTLQYLVENYGHLQDSSCASKSASVRHKVMGKEELDKGIQSGRFLINDLDEKAGALKSSGAYVDLCAGTVRSLSLNMGTGSGGKSFADVNNAHTTLAGAFMVNSQSAQFHPFKMNKQYRAALKNLGDKSAIRLVGLNTSNNDTDYGKPIHVSPYRSSWGCPSLNRKDADIIPKLTADGKTSLLMNYSHGRMQKLGEGATCENGNGGPAPRKTQRRRTRPVHHRRTSQ